jgi:hypothetical protein
VNGADARDPRRLDSTSERRQRSGMKLSAPRPVVRKKSTLRKRAKPVRPSFADFAKRVAGMIEGAPDLSSREGFRR